MKVYAGFNKDFGIRLGSSSGGVFTALSKKILNENGVVYGVKFNSDLSLEYYAAEKMEDLEELRKSKYIQSTFHRNNIENIQKQLLEGRNVLFCGTPCHAKAVKNTVKTGQEHLYIIDFVCHGVPYKKAWDAYVEYQENLHKAKIISVDFRNKENSWKNYSIRIEFSNGDVYCRPYMEDSYMQAFLYDLILSPGCYDCQYKGIERNTDITIGDFWGIEKIMPEMDDDKGTSLIITHNKKGDDLLTAALDEMNIRPILDNDYIVFNPSLINSAQKPPFCEYVSDRLGKRRFDKLVRDCIAPTVFSKVMRKINDRMR